MDEVGVESPTDKITGRLVIPDMAAVIFVFPSATPVAKPTEEMVATVLSELIQVT